MLDPKSFDFEPHLFCGHQFCVHEPLIIIITRIFSTILRVCNLSVSGNMTITKEKKEKKFAILEYYYTLKIEPSFLRQKKEPLFLTAQRPMKK